MLLRQREAERNVADIGDGVSASLSGPELEVGDGGGREEETEGWRRGSETTLHEKHILSFYCHMCKYSFFGFLRF